MDSTVIWSGWSPQLRGSSELRILATIWSVRITSSIIPSAWDWRFEKSVSREKTSVTIYVLLSCPTYYTTLQTASQTRQCCIAMHVPHWLHRHTQSNQYYLPSHVTRSNRWILPQLFNLWSGSCSIFETSLESYPKILINTFQAFAQELFNNIQKRFQKCGTDVTVNSVSHLLDPQFILHEFIGAYKSAREGVSQISDSGLVGRRRAE